MEKPILFSAPMVRALLAGTKTQTRRVVTVPWYKSERALPYSPCWDDVDGTLYGSDEYGKWFPATKCLATHGRVGDRLWVREAWRPVDENGIDVPPGIVVDRESGCTIRYRADCDYDRGGWRPSIFMPRWASRITLELTDVRVERLQAISEADAMAEGCSTIIGPARGAYALLWDVINVKKDGCVWADNPWVWVLSFRKINGK